jgi:hypothetical protein
MTDNEDTDFEAFDLEKLIARLNEHQPPTSGVSAFERLTAAILSKSKAELRYPFPVRVEILGHSGTGAGVTINGAGAFLGAGNGVYTLAPGWSITANQGSTGSGQWRWWGLD